MLNNIDQIATTQMLTKELMLEKIFGGYKNTFKIRKRKKDLTSFIDEIAREAVTYDRQFIIYIILRLWDDGKVKKFNFRSAYKKEKHKIVHHYYYWYYSHIRRIQDQFFIV